MALFNSAGNLIKTESEEYSVIAPHPGWVELDPETVWRAFVKSLRLVINHFNIPETSYAMSFSFLGEPLILARRDGSLFADLSFPQIREVRPMPVPLKRNLARNSFSP